MNGKGSVPSSLQVSVSFTTSTEIIPHNTPVLTVCSANDMDMQRFIYASHCQRIREIYYMRPISMEKIEKAF